MCAERIGPSACSCSPPRDKVAYMRGDVNDLQKDILAARADKYLYTTGMQPTELFRAVEMKQPTYSSLVVRHRLAGVPWSGIKDDAMQFADEAIWHQLPKIAWEEILQYWQLFPTISEC